MALFGRKPAVPQMGILINLAEYQQEMATATRPGIPRDGRYWVSLIETNGDISRLLWERAANYQEAQSLLKDFERTYGKKPKLASSARVDDVTGVWYVEPRGKPDAVLTISHPIMLQYPAY